MRRRDGAGAERLLAHARLRARTAVLAATGCQSDAVTERRALFSIRARATLGFERLAIRPPADMLAILGVRSRALVIGGAGACFSEWSHPSPCR